MSSEDWQPASATSKSLFSLLPVVQHAACLEDQEHGPADVLLLHHCQDQGTNLRTLEGVRPDVVLEAHQQLLASHNLYSGVDPGEHLKGLENLLEDLVMTGVVTEDAQAQHTVYSVLVPDRPGLSPQTRQVLELGDLPLQLAAIYDPREEAGLQQAREVVITNQQWWHQRLANCQLEGPGDRPGLVLARVLEYVCQQAQFAGAGRMMDVPGSRGFLKKVRNDLDALVSWHGAPAFFFSASCPPLTDLAVATWVSHQAGLYGRKEQVWHVGLEQSLLTPLPGRQLVREDGGYFVHSWVENKVDSCPFHEFCSRRPVGDWRGRWVQLYNNL